MLLSETTERKKISRGEERKETEKKKARRGNEKGLNCVLTLCI